MSPRASNLLAAAACLTLAGWFYHRGERFIAANGPTFDEAIHLAAGYGYWTAGAFKMNHEDPPVLKLLWSFPLLFADAPKFPRETAASKNGQWHAAAEWVYGSGADPRELIDAGRRVNRLVGCAMVLLAGWVAYRVWGSRLAAVAASGFAAADPTLLALSCVVKTDAGAALFGFAACYLVWEYVGNPSRRLLVAAGVALGLALGAKFSTVALVAGLGLAGAVYVRRGGVLAVPGEARGGPRPAVELALRMGGIAAVTVACSYAFVHFPEWPAGLKFQLMRDPNGSVAYLNGETAARGWFHYFVVAAAVKLPLGLLLAAGVSAVSLLATGRESLGPRAAFLVLPPLVFFALASYSRLNLGVRVILPCLPFLYLLAAGLATSGRWRHWRLKLVAALLAWCAVAAERAGPWEISSFNELAGGPGGGMKFLADSNLDWGQGLPALKQWMDANGIDAVYLAYFGTDRPEAHGIWYQHLPGYGRIGPSGGEPIPANTPRHVVAVSANHLLGLFLNEPETYAWLRDRTPTAVVAGSIYVFDLTADPDAVARVRVIGSR